MRYIYLLIILLYISSCTEKSSTESQTSPVVEQNSEVLLQELKLLKLPLHTEDFPRNVISKATQDSALHAKTVDLMQLRDTLTNPTDPYYFWLVGKLKENDIYSTVIVGSIWNAGLMMSQATYSLVTFTKEGTRIDKLNISGYTGEEGTSYDSDSFIDREGNIITKTKSSYEEDLADVTEENYTLDDHGKFKKSESKTYPEETQVDWYYSTDVGLLLVEKLRAGELYFTLKRRSDELCTEELTWVATPDGGPSTYSFAGDETLLCSITITLKDKGLTIDQDDHACPNQGNCAYEGDFEKVASEKRSASLVNVTSWMRKPIGEFSCILKEKFSTENKKFPCNYEYTSTPNPAEPSWYEGPEFPIAKIKMIHPLIENIQIDFEHGDLRVLTITLEKEMSVQSIKKIFDLPEISDNLDYGIYQITYGNQREDELNPRELTTVKEFTIEGFEHMGSGD